MEEEEEEQTDSSPQVDQIIGQGPLRPFWRQHLEHAGRPPGVLFPYDIIGCLLKSQGWLGQVGGRWWR